jgi:phage gp36-like protein
MAYITIEDLKGKVPYQHLADALDDNKDGQPDAAVVALVLQDASDRVDQFLERQYTVPVTAAMFSAGALPKLVKNAAKLFAAQDVYKRRNVEFPWQSELDECVKALEAIQKGEESLPGIGGRSPGALVSEDATVDDSMR